jgi:hypothetical protein
LRDHADALARGLYGALQHQRGAEGAGDRRYALPRSLVTEGRGPGDDAQAADTRQRVDDLVGQRVAEHLVRRLAGEVGERQHRDNRFRNGSRRQPPPQHRQVAALRQFDHEGIVAALGFVVLGELAAQAPRLGTHDRVALRIEHRRVAT